MERDKCSSSGYVQPTAARGIFLTRYRDQARRMMRGREPKVELPIPLMSISYSLGKLVGTELGTDGGEMLCCSRGQTGLDTKYNDGDLCMLFIARTEMSLDLIMLVRTRGWLEGWTGAMRDWFTSLSLYIQPFDKQDTCTCTCMDLVGVRRVRA